MITVEKTIDLPDTYPLDRLGKLEELLFFDIETTGFSGDYSNLYLIGCTYYSQNSWHLIQWFADSSRAERDVLAAFFEFMKGYTKLIHFNGDGFDIPYLLKRCHSFGLPYDFSHITSIDIYRRIKPYRNLLQLDSMKQKSIERFLGIHRQDPYSGGQLIEVYFDYLTTHESELYDMLMLHNAEDLQGMPLILPILSYPDLLEHDLSPVDWKVSEQTDLFGDPEQVLRITCKSSAFLPVPVEREMDFFSCEAVGNQMIFTIPLYVGELKYFYPNYKDYYYLPYEDTAIHKSIGEYVDKDAKTKATARTCYTKKQGRFLPQHQILWEPALQSAYKDKITYIEYQESLFEDSSQLLAYTRQLIAAMM